MSHIVFLSVFLGLVSGLQPVEVRVSPDVKSVRFFVAGKLVALLEHAPWKTGIDFGESLDPREFVAVAYDERGDELGRATQTLNLKRPVAELQIVVRNDEHDLPASVELVGKHLQFLKIKSASIRFDYRKLKMRSKLTADLPKVDWTQSHVISAEAKFQDGLVVRSESVVSGGFSDSVGSQLSGVLITGAPKQRLENCFSIDGNAVHVSAVEKTKALVMIVREPDPTQLRTVLNQMEGGPFSGASRDMMHTAFDGETTVRVIWPVAEEYRDEAARTVLYENSAEMHTGRRGLLPVLTMVMIPAPDATEPRRFSDAVAVAAIQTYMPARRRAVILVLGDAEDRSSHRPADVRRYLGRIGVPLFVWSFSGPRPELADVWGPVEDVSTPEKYRDAVMRVRKSLDSQSVVWIGADPLSALRAEVKDSCGVSVVAAAK